MGHTEGQRPRRGTAAVVAVMAVVMLLVAACSTTESSSGSEPTETDSGGERTASDTGVTADAIRVAYLAPDLEALAQIGVAEATGDPQVSIDALVASVNDAGGINGRKLEVNPIIFDATKIPAALVSACTQVASDSPNFVAFASSFFGDGAACLAGDEGVPLVTGNALSGDVMAQTDGNAYLFNLTFEESQRAMVEALAPTGAFDGRKLGVVVRDEPGGPEAVSAGLAPALAAAGFDLAETAVISGGATGDPASISAAVQRFKDAGVDGVFLTANVLVSGSFITEAERQGLRASYFGSDQSEIATSLITNFAPVSALEGARATSFKRQGEAVLDTPASEQDQRCLEIRDAVQPPLAEQGTTEYNGFMELCAIFQVMVDALEAAGANPTRASFETALDDIGQFDMGTGSTGSFGPDKRTAPDAVRPLEFRADCTCWVPTGPFVDITR
jgi:ABC-type branched-subunit amino acid transport system substrate-binding protein